MMDVEGFVFVLALDYDVLVKRLRSSTHMYRAMSSSRRWFSCHFGFHRWWLMQTGFLGELIRAG